MFLITAMKVLVIGFAMFPIAFAALGVGFIFGCFLIGLSRNPAEKDTLFANAMVAFVIVESFVFTALLVGALVFILVR